MVQLKTKKRSYKAVWIIAALLVVAIGIVILLLNLNKSEKADPYKQVETTNTQDNPTDTDAKTDTDTTPKADDKKDTDTSSSDVKLDPSMVKTVDIQPMSLTVSYLKDTPGFEFYVLRTANGTQYVAFSSPELVGTKCTNDKGVFASIIQSPSSNESATLSKTATVGDTKYGLSLADATCTPDGELLKQYQKSFSDAFSLLKKSS